MASHGRRIGAYFLSVPLAIVTLGIGYIIWGLMIWGNGQTPALQVLGMRVWRPAENQVLGPRGDFFPLTTGYGESAALTGVAISQT